MKNFWQKLPRPFFVLAPMADVTDSAFRRVIAKYGRPHVMYTEFVSIEGLFKGGKDVLMKDLVYTESERPIVAQFFGTDTKLMEKAAALAVELKFDGVDINMGCPDSKVCKQGAGAALIQTPELAQELIYAAKQGAGALPVSVKTRIGYNTNELETWLPALLEAQPAIVALHARTKKQMSKVPADWEVIARAVEIRNELKSDALIVGNGDVTDLEDAREKAQESGCEGIMLGRAIFGNPWLFSEQKQPDYKERLHVLIEHTKHFEELLGGTKSFAKIHPVKSSEAGAKQFNRMKKHFKAYVNGFDGAKELRMALMETINAAEVEHIITAFTSAQ